MIFYLLTFLPLIVIVFGDDQPPSDKHYQTLYLNYSNYSSCNNSYQITSYHDQCSDSVLNYDQCCQKLLDKYQLIPQQKVNVCYHLNNSNYYLYTCRNNGKFNSIFENKVREFFYVIIILLTTILLASCVLLCYIRIKRLHHKNNYIDINNYGSIQYES